jgi:hypothetical protein
VGLLGCALHAKLLLGGTQGEELASSVTWLPEEGIRWYARSKQLLDDSASVTIRILILKERLDGEPCQGRSRGYESFPPS